MFFISFPSPSQLCFAPDKPNVKEVTVIEAQFDFKTAFPKTVGKNVKIRKRKDSIWFFKDGENSGCISLEMRTL